MTKGKAAYDANEAEIAARERKPSGPRKQLTPEALLGYGFKRTPPDMSDEAIEAINAEWAPGGEHYGDDPIREMEN
jgi:NAD(P)H-hydrate repair Nnr-like enzyme with NAD(P)H-hydrate epimerase domain